MQGNRSKTEKSFKTKSRKTVYPTKKDLATDHVQILNTGEPDHGNLT